jgi:hypothetical protein
MEFNKEEIKSKIKQIALFTVILVIGIAVGWYYSPEKVTTKTETKIEIKEVVKVVEVKTEDRRNNIVTTVTEKTEKDGTKETVTTIVDKSTDFIVDSTKTDIKKETETVAKTETVTEKSRNTVIISALGIPYLPNGRDNLIPYPFGVGIQVQKKIGFFYLGTSLTSDKTFGISIGIGF